jgi:hypothetical protein
VPVEHFRSKEAYRRWTAYRHIHGIPAPHLKEVVIGKDGKRHKVQHSSLFHRRKKKKGDSLFRRKD